MAETESTPSLPIIEEEEVDDDFYEKIEAPKFVDFTAPDNRPIDDRYWFCLRVGCDQKHAEELDSEAIYKNFVLRVMAARSPNVKFRKALSKREASSNLKCPHTAPAKSSKSRVSRLALISSMSQKIVDNNVRAKKPLYKACATPNAKVKQPSSMAKALTTPRNQKKVSNVEQFRTVQSKKVMSVVVPKNRVLAKTLVFPSPKKAIKIKSSVELKTPIKSLCSAMKKLELNTVKKNVEGCNKTVSAAASRKQFRGREVKSRVFDSLYSNGQKGKETNLVKRLKEKKVAKDTQKCPHPQPHEEGEIDSSDMEIDERSRVGSLGKCPESQTSGDGNEVSVEAVEVQEPKILESSTEASSDISRPTVTTQSSLDPAEGKRSEECELKEKSDRQISEEVKSTDGTEKNDKEHDLPSDDKENDGELTENDEKENATAPDENRVLNISNKHTKKTILGAKHEDSRKTQKKLASTATGPQAVKYRKPKLTNPKPFKLRTDERGILKEANLEKKLLTPMKEETTVKGGKTMRKQNNVNQESDSCLGQSENDTGNYNSCEERSDQATKKHQTGSIHSSGPCGFNANRKVKPKLSVTTPHGSAGPKLRQDKAAKRLDGNSNRKSQTKQSKFVRPRSTLSRKKERVLLATAGKLSVITESSPNILQPKEASKPCNNGASPRNDATKAISKPFFRGRRATTVPREPHFHSLHVPKSCTRKLI